MEKFWTEELYEKAYDIVKDRKFPIVIPSCNRPNPLVLDKFLNDTYNDEYWPVWFIVRNSQEAEYRKNITRPNTWVVGFPDEEINDYGKAKQKCVEFAHTQKFDFIFSLDDDLEDMGFKRLKIMENGNKYARPAIMNDFETYDEDHPMYNPKKSCNSCKFFALWQLVSEVCFDKYKSLYISLNLKSFGFSADNVDKENSLKLISGKSPMQALNVKELMKKDYKFNSDKEVGFSDLDFMINLYKNKEITSMIPWMYYDMPKDGVSVDNYPYYKDLYERLTVSMDKLFNCHTDIDFIRRKDQKNKALGTIKNAGIQIETAKIRKQMNMKNYKFNIYEDIKEIYNI